MPWAVPAAIAGGSLIGAIGSWLGGNSAADAQRDAANAQLRGMQQAIAAQQAQYAQGRQDMLPFMQSDLAARQAMMGSINAGADDPYYQRIQQLSDRDLNAQFAKGGSFGSGPWAEAMALSHAGIANQQLHDRYQRLGMLFGNTGGQMANLSGDLGRGLAGSYQQGYGGYGAALGQSGQYSGQALSGALGAIGQGAIGAAGAYGNYQNNQGLKGILGGGAAAGSTGGFFGNYPGG